MKILLYGLNFAPELTGIGKYTGEMAQWLAERGHNVRVVTAPPYYPEWKVQAGYSSWRWRTDRGVQLQVWRCPLWVPAKAGGLKRILHLLSFGVSSLPVLLRQIAWCPDVVWTVEPALVGAPAASFVAWTSGGRAWLHIQDYEVDAAFDMGLLKGDGLRRFALSAERWLMRRFDRVSTISGRMMDLARRKGLPDDQLVFFPNWVDISLVRPQATSSYRAELGIATDAVVCLYSGNMGNKQGLEILADAARLLQGRPDIQFVFCGGGSGREDLERRCEGLPNVRFLPLQPLARLSDLLAVADVHLLPQRADAADLVMPSKLGGMVASGRCVLATAAEGTELADVVAGRAACGVVVPPEQPQAFADAVVGLADDPAGRARMGANGRAFAEREIERDAILQAFERELAALTGQDLPAAAMQPGRPG